MNTDAQTAHTFFRKRLLSFLLTLMVLFTCLPAAFAVDLSIDAGFYFKQSRGGTCTLASAAMMLRRRAYLDGLNDWTDVTENSVRTKAWSNGLSHSFTYKEMQVGYATLPSGTVAKTGVLVQLLAEHPEGVVLYDRTQPHAVLLTDYTDGVFYCSDPAGNISSGRIPLTSSSVSLSRASCYWYVTSDHNSAVAQIDDLRLEGMRYPVNIRTGSGMGLTGTAASSNGTTLTGVQIAIMDQADRTVQSAEMQVNGTSWSFKELDSQIRFGELPEGVYTYMVMVTDSKGESLCFASDFTVSGGAASTATYWSVQDTAGEKLTQKVQQAASSVSGAAEKTKNWFESLFNW